MKIATWNVNSIRKRSAAVLAWLERQQPDLLLLQELKCLPEQFPLQPLQDQGWHVELVGQKAYNGVAIIARQPLEVTARALPGDDTDSQARYIEARCGSPGKRLRVASIYVPNGNPVDSDKFPYKLDFLRRLREHAAGLLEAEEITVLAGDFNVCPTAIDLYDPVGWAGDALFRPQSRAAFRSIVNLGYTEAWRALHPSESGYTFWDYQAGAWQKDHGLRIDHLLLSPQAADRLRGCSIDRAERGRSDPSDHVPIWCELDLDA